MLSVTAEDLIINLKDYPGLKEKDVVEIYHPENDFPRLLLQVTKEEVPCIPRGKHCLYVLLTYGIFFKKIKGHQTIFI